MEYVRPKTIQLKGGTTFGGEAKIQEIIANDPSVLSLGPLKLINKEFQLPGGGILDILLSDSSDEVRYEVEVQLGETDESHIIRTIEYWDLMRKRYPEYQHRAVIIAEKITSRFFNVIGLFNQYLPIIAIQVSGIEVNGHFTLVFTKVLELAPQRSQSEEEYQPPTRKVWEDWASPATIKLADQVLGIAQEFKPSVEFKFNRAYIGTTIGGKRSNLLMFRPQIRALKLSINLESTSEIDKLCEEAGFDVKYDQFWWGYQFDVLPETFDKHNAFFRDLLNRLYASKG